MEKALEADIGIKKRKKLKDLGYASDSEEDNESYNRRIENEDKDSMFGSDDEADQDGGDKSEGKKKEVRFLGTVDGENGGGDDELEGLGEDYEGNNSNEDDEDDDDDDDEDMEDNQAKEPKIEKFNLREEREQGSYDQDGNYIRNNETSDNENHQDAWLQDFNKKKNIKQAKRAQEKQQERQRQRIDKVVPLQELLHDLAVELNASETPLEALSRLNSTRHQEPDSVNLINKVTELCNKLMDQHDTNAYDWERERIIRKYSQVSGKSWVEMKKRKREDEQDSKWEFKWEEDGEVQGVYTTKEMDEWRRYNYFDGFDVTVRDTASSDQEFKPIDEVF